MTADQITAALGIEGLEVSFQPGRIILHSPHGSAVINPDATIDQMRVALGRATPLPSPPSIIAPKPSNRTMGILGLQSGALKGVVDELRAEVGSALNQGIADARGAKDDAKKEIQAAVADIKDKVKSEVADVLHELAEFTNGPQT